MKQVGIMPNTARHGHIYINKGKKLVYISFPRRYENWLIPKVAGSTVGSTCRGYFGYIPLSLHPKPCHDLQLLGVNKKPKTLQKHFYGKSPN
jgi:hypothetical protein